MTGTMRAGLPVYVLGLVLLLAGDVLPWYREPGASVWGWDVSFAWAVSGRIDSLRTPPAVAAVLLVVAIALAVPVMRGRLFSAPLAAGLAAAALGISGLALYRGLTLPRAVPPHAGLIAAIAGSALVAVGALVLSGAEENHDRP